MDTTPLLAPPDTVDSPVPADVAEQIAALDALAPIILTFDTQITASRDAGDVDSVHRLYNAAKLLRKQADMLFDAAEQALAKTVGKGATSTGVGFVQVRQVADSQRADWPKILDTCETAALYDRESGERVDDPATAVQRFREIVEAVAPLTASVMPRAALDSILPREDVVRKEWGGRYNVTST